jgi:hypothetical protein
MSNFGKLVAIVLMLIAASLWFFGQSLPPGDNFYPNYLWKFWISPKIVINHHKAEWHLIVDNIDRTKELKMQVDDANLTSNQYFDVQIEQAAEVSLPSAFRISVEDGTICIGCNVGNEFWHRSNNPLIK